MSIRQKYSLLISLIPVVIYLIFQLPVNLKANTIIVPDDYPTIQQAIDASQNGDTVIVEPGRYVEGIDFKNKAITVASRFYTEQDTSYIRKTIIDGNKEVPNVVAFSGDSNSPKLIGFTITGGHADIVEPFNFQGGGVKVDRSSLLPPPVISDCIIRDNYALAQGGGVYSLSGMILKNTKIYNNTSRSGGGVWLNSIMTESEIVNCEIYSNNAETTGGGLHIGGPGDKIRVTDCVIYNNNSGFGGGISIVNSNYDINIENSVIFDNVAEHGGGIHVHRQFNSFLYPEGITKFINCTVVNNSSVSVGGGLYLEKKGISILINSAFYNNSPQEIYFSPDDEPNMLAVAYSNIKGGESGILINDNGTLNWLEGNIDKDPLFTDPDNNDYRLTENSPFIDAGIARYYYDGKLMINLPESKYYRQAPDMGAFEWWGVSTGHNIIPSPSGSRIELYPNPFNPETTIKFSLQKAGDVILSIYNTRGQRVLKLVEAFLDKGEHYYAWNGKDGEDNPVTSGVYLVKLEHNDEITVTKTTLMK